LVQGSFPGYSLLTKWRTEIEQGWAMDDTGAIDELTAQVNELARFCAQLSRENVELRSQVFALSARPPLAAVWTAPPPAAGPGSPGESDGEPGINRRTAGLALVGAVAGVAGTVMLTDRKARPAATTTTAGSAPVELTAAKETTSATSTDRFAGGMLAPTVITLVDAPSITVNAALGNDFRVTLGGSRTLANPSSGVDGQRITFTIKQGTGAPHKVAWSSQYKFGAAGAPVLSTTAGSIDVIGFVFNQALGSWLCVGAARGF
jgi:hypothetical protein